MVERSRAVITRVEERPREAWEDPVRGRLSWFTLISSHITPTDSLSAGVAELPPGGGSRIPHRHAEAELYFIIEGTGVLTIDGQDTVVGAGTTAFIPGDAAHCLHNTSDSVLRLFYVFPTNSFLDVVYRFPETTASGAPGAET